MTINLYDVLSIDGNIKEYEVSFDKTEQTFQGEKLIISGKEAFTLTIQHVSKDVVTIKGKVILKVIRPCARCLEDVECEYIVTIDEKVNAAKKIAYDTSEDILNSAAADNTNNSNFEDEICYIEDCTLDVDRLILDELYTVLPMSVLCKEDCKGICKVCGTNLNKSSCDCDQTVPDPRMAVFSDIFKQFTVSDDTDIE